MVGGGRLRWSVERAGRWWPPSVHGVAVLARCTDSVGLGVSDRLLRRSFRTALPPAASQLRHLSVYLQAAVSVYGFPTVLARIWHACRSLTRPTDRILHVTDSITSVTVRCRS